MDHHAFNTMDESHKDGGSIQMQVIIPQKIRKLTLTYQNRHKSPLFLNEYVKEKLLCHFSTGKLTDIDVNFVFCRILLKEAEFLVEMCCIRKITRFLSWKNEKPVGLQVSFKTYLQFFTTTRKKVVLDVDWQHGGFHGEFPLLACLSSMPICRTIQEIINGILRRIPQILTNDLEERCDFLNFE